VLYILYTLLILFYAFSRKERLEALMRRKRQFCGLKPKILTIFSKWGLNPYLQINGFVMIYLP
jgi:hypothetical protein